jgi:hypothetical protein
MDTFPLSQTGLARNRGVKRPWRVQERIQVLHRPGVAPNVHSVFELKIRAWA